MRNTARPKNKRRMDLQRLTERNVERQERRTKYRLGFYYREALAASELGRFIVEGGRLIK